MPSALITAQLATEGNTVRLSHAFIQPMAAEDVANAVVEAIHRHAANAFDDIHVVGRNASKTEPAKFVVVLVKNKGAPDLIPVQ